jgi:type II secretory pathway component PulF
VISKHSQSFYSFLHILATLLSSRTDMVNAIEGSEETKLKISVMTQNTESRSNLKSGDSRDCTHVSQRPHHWLMIMIQ